MEQHSEQLGERIDDIEDDWERKEQDASVPGAQPDPDEERRRAPSEGRGLAGADDALNLGGVDAFRGPVKAGLRRCSPSGFCCCSSTRRR